MDLDDLEHNTRDGLHIASLAGTWIALVAGFGGMRDHGGGLSFAPRLPPALTRLAFRLCFRERAAAGRRHPRRGDLHGRLRRAAGALPPRRGVHGRQRRDTRPIPAPPGREQLSQPPHRSPTDALGDPEGDTRD